MEYLLALLLGLYSLDQWKADVYATKYDAAVREYIAKQKEPYLVGAISWYGTGTKGNYTACWDEFPKGTLFKVTFNGKSVVVKCNDRGHFKPLGRVLDLSRESFEQLAATRSGIIRGAQIEVVK